MNNVCRKHGSPELPSTTPQRAGETEVDQENGGLINEAGTGTMPNP